MGTQNSGVIVAKCDNSISQQWSITGDGKIMHKSSDKFLTVLGCQPAPPKGGAPLGLAGDDLSCQGHNQHFSINSGNHTITSAIDGSCLDVSGGQLGNFVELHWCKGVDNEQWQINGTMIMPHKPKGSCLMVSESVVGKGEIWMKILADGTRAVLLLNLEKTSGQMTANFTTIGITSGKSAKVRDLWAQKELGVFTEKFTAKVEGHGVVFVKIIEL